MDQISTLILLDTLKVLISELNLKTFQSFPPQFHKKAFLEIFKGGLKDFNKT